MSEVKNQDEGASQNTDREIWRSADGSDRIMVTEGGSLGIGYNGEMFIKPIEQWHALASSALRAGLAAPDVPEPTFPDIEEHEYTFGPGRKAPGAEEVDNVEAKLRSVAEGLRATAANGKETIIYPEAADTFADAFVLAADIFAEQYRRLAAALKEKP
jgi:hypothetical protein